MASRTSKVISLSLAQGILMLVGIVSGMVFARNLSISDYGTYLQTFLAYDFAVPILTLGLPSALYYYLPNATTRQKGLVLDNLLLLFVMGLIFSVFMLFGGTKLLSKQFNNPDLFKTLNWMVFYPLYTFPALIAGVVWVIKDKVKLNAIYNISTGLILTISMIILVMITKSYEAPIIARIFLPLLFLPVSLYYIFKSVPGNWDKPSLTSMLSMAKFSLPLGVASIFGTLTIQLASLIVSVMTTPEEFAIYANGAKEIPFIGIITASISVVIMADMAQKIKENNFKIALELFQKAAIVSASFLLPIMVFLMIYAESFIEILYSSKYEESVIPFRIYLLVIPVRIAYYGSAFIALGKTKAILIRSIIDLILNLVFCYLFVLWFGSYGAAIGLILTLFVWSVPFNLYSLSKSFNCLPTEILPFKIVGRILFISVLSGILPCSLLLLNLNPILRFSLGATLYGLFYFFAAFKRIPIVREMIIPYTNFFYSRK